jgi:Phospholipid methyltransferase
MYGGGFLMFLGMPLALGSWWGLLVLAVVMPALIWRLLDQEKLLTEKTAGLRGLQEQGALAPDPLRVVGRDAHRPRSFPTLSTALASVDRTSYTSGVSAHRSSKGREGGCRLSQPTSFEHRDEMLENATDTQVRRQSSGQRLSSLKTLLSD